MKRKIKNLQKLSISMLAMPRKKIDQMNSTDKLSKNYKTQLIKLKDL